MAADDRVVIGLTHGLDDPERVLLAYLMAVEALRKDERRQFVLHMIRGQALFGLAKYEEALEDLTQANRIYNSETAVLNGLGRCYEKLGRRAEALDAFKASLKLNSDQPEVKKIVEGLSK